MLLTVFGDQSCRDESRSSGFALCISCYTQVKLLFLTLMVLLCFSVYLLIYLRSMVVKDVLVQLISIFHKTSFWFEDLSPLGYKPIRPVGLPPFWPSARQECLLVRVLFCTSLVRRGRGLNP